MDSFEELKINSDQIRKACEAACQKFGSPINYRDLASEGEDPEGSMGPRLRLWRRVEITARSVISRSWGGGDDPSPFKVLAGISVALVEVAPIPEFFPEDYLKEEGLPKILSLRYAPAAVVAVDYSLSVLHGSKVGDALEELKHPLKISPHFFHDLLASLTMLAKELRRDKCDKLTYFKVPFGLLALVYESISYKTNPHAEHQQGVLVFQREPA